MKILIVDDSLLDRKLLMRVLEKGGVDCDIIQADNGEAALEIIASQYKDIKLIFLDWQMPKMSGIEVLEGVAKVPLVAHIPIIMCTASGSQENQERARSVNPNLAGYIIKPYKADEVLAAVKPHF